MVDDAKTARLDAHRNNIRRYRGLLETHLKDVEREYIEQRLSEELAVVRATTPRTSRQTVQFVLAVKIADYERRRRRRD
jgi:hypothetical protein